jgi:hypothetical protein
MPKRYKLKLIPKIPEFIHEDPLAPVYNETARANKALRDYALMGAGRSLHGLENRYIAMEAECKKNPARHLEKPPTTRWMTIGNWSSQFRWQERIKVHDEIVRKAEEERYLEDKLKWREHRLRAAKNLLSKAVVALNNHEGPATLSQIAKALETAMKELRVEFGEEQQITSSNDVTIRVVRENKKITSGEED